MDDGSTDNSGKICDEYVKKDNRVTVIHKSNGGLSDARNAGIQASTGDFLSFIDSDDFVHEKFIQKMYSLMINCQADIVICGYEKGEKDNFSVKKKSKERVVVFNSAEMLQQWHGKYKHVETMAWNKLYRRKLFIDTNIMYPIGYYNEDVQTTHLLVEAAEKIVITNEKLYYYFQRFNSIVNTVSRKSIEDNLYSQNVRLAYFKKGNQISAYKRLKIKLQKYYMLTYCSIPNCGMKDIEQQLLDKYMQSYVEIMQYNEVRLFERVLFFLFKRFYSITKFIYKNIRRICHS